MHDATTGDRFGRSATAVAAAADATAQPGPAPLKIGAA